MEKLQTEVKNLIAIAREEVKKHYHLWHVVPLIELFGAIAHEEGVAFNVCCLTLAKEDVPLYILYLQNKLQYVLGEDFRPPLMSFTDDPNTEVLSILISCLLPLLNY